MSPCRTSLAVIAAAIGVIVLLLPCSIALSTRIVLTDYSLSDLIQLLVYFGVARVDRIEVEANSGCTSDVDATILDTWVGSAPKTIRFRWPRPVTEITEGGRVVVLAFGSSVSSSKETVYVPVEPVTTIDGRDCFLYTLGGVPPENTIIDPHAGGEGVPMVSLTEFAAAARAAAEENQP